jgi:hypothetical protein
LIIYFIQDSHGQKNISYLLNQKRDKVVYYLKK